MGMTLLYVGEHGGNSVRLFVSHDYSVDKECDANGNYLPDQDWQHPDPTTLRYTELGRFSCPESFQGFLRAWLSLGVREFGTHIRLIEEGAADIVRGREQTWQEKLDRDQSYLEELEAERERKRLIEEQQRAPIYEWCNRCGGQREICKNPTHRGI